jgi:hypothetical protein
VLQETPRATPNAILEKMKAARHALEDDGQPFSPAIGPLKS